MRPIKYGIIIMVVLGCAAAWAAGDPVAGKAKFNMFCATCHGATGKGDGPGAAALNPKPKNLSVSTLSEADMAKIIKEGGAAVGRSPLMPPWKSALNDQDIANVIAYVKTLK